MFDFENYLRQELKSDKIIVLEEQMFAKHEEFEPEKIYVVTKYLTSSIEYGAETQPVQILILSEQNGLQEAKDLFDTFTQTHNWLASNFNGTFVKQQYTSPVVMSNFNEVSYGYRSVLYVSATLYIMNNVADVEYLALKGVPIKPLNFTWSYTMTGNTQPIGNELIASTVKNIATFQCTLSIPILTSYKSSVGFSEDTVTGGTEDVTTTYGTIQVNTMEGYKIVASVLVGSGSITKIDQDTGEITWVSAGAITIKYDYVSNNLLGLILKVSAGQLSGNVDFELTFSVYNVDFEFDCKLTSVQMVSMPNDIPVLNVGLQR